MKRRIPIVILIVIILLTGCINNKKDKTTNFRNSERKENIIKIFKESLIKNDYINEDNLKTFEVIKILYDGYYKSYPNNKYMQIDFIFTCKDGSNDCVKTLNAISDYGYYTLWINTDENNVYDIMSGISISKYEMDNKEYIREVEEIK